MSVSTQAELVADEPALEPEVALEAELVALESVPEVALDPVLDAAEEPLPEVAELAADDPVSELALDAEDEP